MIEIDRIEEKFHASLFGGELRVQVDCRDSEGNPHMVVFTAFAIRDLASKLDDAYVLLVDQAIDPAKPHGFTIAQGPTRGEVYMP